MKKLYQSNCSASSPTGEVHHGRAGSVGGSDRRSRTRRLASSVDEAQPKERTLGKRRMRRGLNRGGQARKNRGGRWDLNRVVRQRRRVIQWIFSPVCAKNLAVPLLFTHAPNHVKSNTMCYFVCRFCSVHWIFCYMSILNNWRSASSLL